MEQAQTKGAKAKTTPKKSASAPVKIKKFARGMKEFECDLYKGDVQKYKHNASWKYANPNIIEMEHRHIYRNVDGKKGRPNKYTSHMLGHFHEIILNDENGNPLVDENGFPAPKCGPPMRKNVIRLPNGKKKMVIEQVKYLDGSGYGPNGENLYIEDNHTHSFEYLGSEMISPERNKRIQEDNAAQVKAMGVKPEVVTVQKNDFE